MDFLRQLFGGGGMGGGAAPLSSAESRATIHSASTIGLSGADLIALVVGGVGVVIVLGVVSYMILRK